MTTAAPHEDLVGAVLEHTAHSAVVVARTFSAAVVGSYSPARQAEHERRLAYRDNTATELDAIREAATR